MGCDGSNSAEYLKSGCIYPYYIAAEGAEAYYKQKFFLIHYNLSDIEPLRERERVCECVCVYLGKKINAASKRIRKTEKTEELFGLEF